MSIIAATHTERFIKLDLGDSVALFDRTTGHTHALRQDAVECLAAIHGQAGTLADLKASLTHPGDDQILALIEAGLVLEDAA